MWYFVSLYMQQVLGYSPIETGLAFLPMTFAIAVASTLAGRLVEPRRPGRVLAAGMTLVAVGMVGFSFVSVDGTLRRRRARPGVITATGLGFSFVPVTIAAVSGVEPPERGPGLGAGQHLAAVRRLARAGGPRHDRLEPRDRSPAQRRLGGRGAHGRLPLAFLVGAAFAAVGALVAAGALARARTAGAAGARRDLVSREPARRGRPRSLPGRRAARACAPRPLLSRFGRPLGLHEQPAHLLALVRGQRPSSRPAATGRRSSSGGAARPRGSPRPWGADGDGARAPTPGYGSAPGVHVRVALVGDSGGAPRRRCSALRCRTGAGPAPAGRRSPWR